MKKYATTLKIAFLTASTVILFQIISLFVVYQYVRFDLYLGLVAVCFLITGFLIARPRMALPASLKPEAISHPSPIHQLTQRELQILELIAEGKTNKEIAAVFYIEVSTVKTHVNNIYTKLSVRNRMEARYKYAEMTEKEPEL
jgi:DNA-binding CsgD family transcriptional regulator